jgi:cell division protein FtsA
MNDMPRQVLRHDTGPPEPERSRPLRTGTFGVVDIGTTKVACLIARVDSDGELRVLGCDWRQGLGVRGGSIVDLEKAERAIRACVGQAENMADTRLRAVIVNLTCGQPESEIYNVKWSLDAPAGGRPVTDHDVLEVLHEGRELARSSGREPVHVIPLTFALDGTDHIVDPRGLYCSTLDARLHVIGVGSSSLRSLEACLQRCDLEIEAMVSSPMAAGMSTLVADEREIGCSVIDMGGGTTNVASFFENQLIHSAQIRVGGLHVTSDLAKGLSTPLSHAERLKTLWGNVGSSPDDDRDMLPVPRVGEADHHLAKVPRSMVVNIIRPRIEETLEKVRDKLAESGLSHATGNRIVLTGGACQLPGLPLLASRILGHDVRVGRPRAIRGMPDIFTGPAFATVTGLLIWACNEGGTFHDADPLRGGGPGWFKRLVNFIKERV